MTFSTRTMSAARRTLIAGGLAAALAAMTVVAAAPARAADPPPGPPVFGAVTATSALGAGGAVPRVVSCPDGSVLTTITATRTTPTAANPLADWLNGVSATCSPVVVATTVALGPAAAAGAIKGVLPGGPSADTPCPAGSVATGLQGAGGALVDRVALRCAALSPTGTLGAVTVAPEAGGPGGGAPGPVRRAGGPGGGAQGPYDCPAGAVATGLAGRTGDDLDALALLCRPLGFPSVAPEEVNTSWPTALSVGGNATAAGTLRAAGQDRWFRFA